MTRRKHASKFIMAILLIVIALPWLFDATSFIQEHTVGERQPLSQTVRVDQSPTAAIDRPTMEHFSAIIERPLFVATRRPSFVPNKLAGKHLVLGKYRVTGIVISPEDQVVMFTSATNKQTVTLRLGDQIDGWALGEVSENKIVLVSKNKRIVIRENMDR